MMPNDTDDYFRQHEEMRQDVPRLLAAQHTIERIDRSLEHIHRTLTHVEKTQARMKTLVARISICKKTATTRRRRL
jgi:hypothetical protein